MPTLRFADLPRLAQIAVGLTFYNTWVLVEETIIDRQGLSRWLPGYEVGCFCIWDIGTILLIAGALAYAARRRNLPPAA